MCSKSNTTSCTRINRFVSCIFSSSPHQTRLFHLDLPPLAKFRGLCLPGSPRHQSMPMCAFFARTDISYKLDEVFSKTREIANSSKIKSTGLEIFAKKCPLASVVRGQSPCLHRVQKVTCIIATFSNWPKTKKNKVLTTGSVVDAMEKAIRSAATWRKSGTAWLSIDKRYQWYEEPNPKMRTASGRARG